MSTSAIALKSRNVTTVESTDSNTKGCNASALPKVFSYIRKMGFRPLFPLITKSWSLSLSKSPHTKSPPRIPGKVGPSNGFRSPFPEFTKISVIRSPRSEIPPIAKSRSPSPSKSDHAKSLDSTPSTSCSKTDSDPASLM